MDLVLVDKNNYKKAIEIQKLIFPNENGTLNILASLNRQWFINNTGLNYVDDHVQYYLAKVDDIYVGITGLYYYDSDNAWLGWFGILPEYRHQGLGRRLLRKTIHLATTMNFKYMRLYTDFIANYDAIILYEKEGFVGEKYTCEKLQYDCRIYSKSLTDHPVDLWNNQNLNLSYQSELECLSKLKIDQIINMYDDIFKN